MKNKIKILLFPITTLSMLFVLQGCGSDKKDPPAVTGAAAFVAGTHPRFDPVISDVPFNTDLIFAKAATTDGTADVGAATDAVRAALNVLDGFSTSAYFDVMISGSVNPATVLPMQTVFLLEVETLKNDKDALNPKNISGLAKMPESLVSFDTQVVSLDGGLNNVVRIRPTAPLKAKTKYLVFLTNDIKDAEGKALTRSWSYNSLHDTSYQTLASLAPVRELITGWETLAGGFLAVATSITPKDAVEKLVLSYTFTTTDAQAPLVAMAAPRAAIASLIVKKANPATPEALAAAKALAVTKVQQLDAGNYLSTPKQRDLGVSATTGLDISLFSSALAANIGKLYTGYIKLPYYQTAAAGLPFAAYLTRNWTADRTLADLLGQTLPADVDATSYNVTYRYPFAAKTGDESVPLQVTLPEASHVPGLSVAPTATCGQIFGATGYPVAIYIHGITSDRGSVVSLAHTLAGRCVATVAIDLPVHGVPANSAYMAYLNVEHSVAFDIDALYGSNAPHERHFNVAGSGGAPAPMNFVTPSALTDGSGAQFINLGYLANTRDNLRQAVMDLLNLNASLAGINDDFLTGLGVSLDLNKVYVVGLSLGGIVGTTFTSVNQAAISSEAAAGLTSNLNPIRGLVASAAGSQVTQILVNSNRFAPIINGGLAANGVAVGTSLYEKFIYATQSMVDSGDVVNFAQLLSTQNVPVLLQQINGDLVIPNSASGAPLAGTLGLANLLGADPLGAAPTLQPLGLGYVRLTEGGHASLLRIENDTPLVTRELQAQVVSFILGAGSVAVGSAAPLNIQAP